MKFFKKLKSGNFWVSLVSAGVLIAEGIFDFEIKTEYLNQILLGLMGILTVFGIVSDHGDSSVVITSNIEENKNQVSENQSVSNIKSICDTVSLLLNKVSINSSVETEHINEVEQVIKEIKNNFGDKEETKKEEIVELEKEEAIEATEKTLEDEQVVEEKDVQKSSQILEQPIPFEEKEITIVTM